MQLNNRFIFVGHVHQEGVREATLPDEGVALTQETDTTETFQESGNEIFPVDVYYLIYNV